MTGMRAQGTAIRNSHIHSAIAPKAKARQTKMDDAQEYADASRILGEMMAEFLDIEGYEYSIRNWSTIGEAMRTVKRESPE